MKKIIISVILLTSFCVLICGCGFNFNLTDNDPPLHRTDITEAISGTPLELTTDGTEDTASGTYDPSGLLSSEWPDNEYTRLVPKPDLNVMTANAEDGEFTAAFSKASIEQIRAYAEKLKAAGFDKDTEVQDQEVMGMVIYTFSAKNADGAEVSLTFTAGTATLSISK